MPGWWKVPYSCQFMQRGRHQQAGGFYRAVCFFLTVFIYSETNSYHQGFIILFTAWIYIIECDGPETSPINLILILLCPKLRFHKNGRTGEYLMRWYLVKKYKKVSNVLNTNVSGLWPFFGGRKTFSRWICLSSDDGPWQAFCLFAFIFLL